MTRWRYLLAGLALVAAGLLVAASGPHFDEEAFYIGPTHFSAGSAHELETFGAVATAPQAVPQRVPPKTLLIFGTCPANLGISAKQLRDWLSEDATLIAMDCTQAQLFTAAGGFMEVMATWEPQASDRANASAATWWRAMVARNEGGKPEEWSFISLRGKQLSSGAGTSLQRLLEREAVLGGF